jgi:hypothetical protein
MNCIFAEHVKNAGCRCGRAHQCAESVFAPFPVTALARLHVPKGENHTALDAAEICTGSAELPGTRTGSGGSAVGAPFSSGWMKRLPPGTAAM